MELAEWTHIFNKKANNLKHSWNLKFDENIVPDKPNPGWKQYIRNTSARFDCSMCSREWPSNWVKVVFHMRLVHRQGGTVKVRALRQNCKNCDDAPMEDPTITPENISILMENLVEKIRIKCYNQNLGKKSRPFRSFDVNSPHEPDHCEACMKGICTRN
ncbi:receptor-transporting protein 3-like [Brachyistius frenatus]|uniref:receptor-transporting protein 3-like n=1 Tax=Brachyistius frenatus TaxID=100188 RepID=UPI0037E7477C